MNVQTTTYKAPDDQVEWLGTDPIPAAPYYDPEYFELERKAIFMRSWLVLGHISEIAEPGSFIRRELEFAKASILIVHGKDGKIRAFHNVCTHRGTQLVEEESGKASSFTCPYHAWNFGYDGELRAAPDFERFFVDKGECSLPKVAVDICAGLIFVNLDPSPGQGLREYLGSYAEELETLPVAKATTFSEYVYEIDGNWKITYDNFQENYHLRFIHPSTGAATISPDNAFGYPVSYGFNGPASHAEDLVEPGAKHHADTAPWLRQRYGVCHGRWRCPVGRMTGVISRYSPASSLLARPPTFLPYGISALRDQVAGGDPAILGRRG